MGKLVLFLADGTTMDVPLDKERITIGRRADNDLCLPYPAVSGEHAAVMTILADSFLEDLGSTNGTLVNGKAVVKHFLVDRDVIDIGRQRLTYRSDDDARVDPLPPDLTRDAMRGLADRVDGVPAVPQVAVPPAGDGRTQFGARATPLDADLQHALPPLARAAAPDAEAPGHAARAPRPAEAAHPAAPAAPQPPSPPLRPARVSAHEAGTVVATDVVPAAPAQGPVVRVLSGPSAGRSMAFAKPELSVGRVGVQVAVVRKVDGGYRLVPLEGAAPPRINGAAVPAGGAPLHPGDTFEVAGVRLELSAAP